MKIAPIDIAHKSFTRKMVGLDTDEVSDFLKAVADEMETLIKERNHFKDSLREKELQILEYRERDKTLKDTITTAQKMSERMREEAEREAKLISNDAHQKADQITRDARDSLKRIYREIADLQKVRVQFEANMRSMIQAHLSLVEQSDQYLPKTRLAGLDISPSSSINET
jgi:cell division initiation protein